MFDFRPEEKKVTKVPFFEDAKSNDGWQGQATTKVINKLQSEISQAIVRLGGIPSNFQRGLFMTENQEREGYQIHYSIQAPNGQFVPGRMDIAALPIRDRHNRDHKEKSLRMALYMLRVALDGMWLLQQLSPGYAALMPWMLTEQGKTVSQLWAESPIMSRLLPPGEIDFIEAEIKEV